MIGLSAATAITLLALQAGINAPTDAFRGCLREATAKATQEKVGADAVEGYLRNACTVQMDSLKAALVAFRVKNGMSKKNAAEDAAMTVDDYVATPVDNYKFLATSQAATPAAAPAPAPVAATAPAAPQSGKKD
jgi:hypothetical protein